MTVLTRIGARLAHLKGTHLRQHALALVLAIALAGAGLVWAPDAYAAGGSPPSSVQDQAAKIPASTRDEIDLNGVWSFTPHDGSVHPGVKTTIRVPDAWDAAPGFFDTTRATYERTVAVPAAWSGRDVFLEIYEANWHVDLVVNGTSFPRRSEGVGVPTNIDVTSAVRFGEDNTIQVTMAQAGLAYAGVRPAGTFRWGQNLGLTGDVFLRSYPRVRVADAFVQTSVRDQRITVEYQIENHAGGTPNLTIEASVLELSGERVLDLAGQTVAAGSSPVAVTLQQPWANPTLWTPADPHLYYLETTLKEGDSVVDSHKVRFGFREVWTEGTRIILNGVPVVLLGDSNDLFQHAFMNYYYQLWYDEATTRQTVAQLKRSRNAIRIHQAPAVRPHVLDVFDEEGILVISESAAYGGSYDQAGQPSLTTYVENTLAWIPNWVRRERNHPSIVIWSAENELGPGWLGLDESELQRLGDRIRELDPTRPIIFEGDHSCCGSDFHSLHYNQDGPGGDWPTDNDVYQYATLWWDGSRPNSQDEYAFVGWNGNGIFNATGGSSYTNLTSMQGTRLRGGLLTRGYRYQGWAMLAPHTYIWQWADLYQPEGRVEDAFVERSFMPVAAFDVEYDRLGENPSPPRIAASGAYFEGDYGGGDAQPLLISPGSAAFTRSIALYNQETQGSGTVTLIVEARADGASAPFFVYNQGHSVPLGTRKDVAVTIQNLPKGSHWIQFELKVVKDGVERFAGETRDFWLDGADSQAPPAPTGLRADVGGGAMGALDRNMVHLTWDMPDPRGDLAGWVIYRGTSPQPTAVEDEVKLWAEREKFDHHNEYFDIVPAAGTYYYRLSAKDLKGNVSGFSNEIRIVVQDSQSPLRDPGFEMESRLYKDANNQYYPDRTWGERWTLPAIVGGSEVAPHGGRFAGLINGDGAHAENAFVDDFRFQQQVRANDGQAYHLGGYVKVKRVWRVNPSWGGIWLSANTYPGWGGEDLGDATIEPGEMAPLQASGEWTYVYTTITARSQMYVHAWQIGGQLVDAYVDDVVLVPLDRIPPAALATADSQVVETGQAVGLDASQSFAFDTNGAAQSPGSGLSYLWDLGNGQTATTAAVQAVYLAPGEHVARVTVTDQKGLSATAQVFISVRGSGIQSYLPIISKGP
jgi:hypothetical protein